MIVCACGNDKVWANGQLNLNVFVCNWMSKWSVDRMTVTVFTQHGLKTELFLVDLAYIYIYIYTHYYMSVCEKKDERKRERRQETDTGIKSFWCQRLFSALAWLHEWKTHQHHCNQHNTKPTTLHENKWLRVKKLARAWIIEYLGRTMTESQRCFEHLCSRDWSLSSGIKFVLC